MDWLRKHGDTLVIVLTILGGFWTTNEKMWDMQKDITTLKTEMAVLKTVMLMKNIMPTELATSDNENN